MILRVVLQLEEDYLFIIHFLRFHLLTCEGSEVKGFLFMRGGMCIEYQVMGTADIFTALPNPF
jgi:hypothetical protein